MTEPDPIAVFDGRTISYRDDLFFASWIDDEMGLLAQVIDLDSGAVLAAIPADDERGTEILVGQLTDRGGLGDERD